MVAAARLAGGLWAGSGWEREWEAEDGWGRDDGGGEAGPQAERTAGQAGRAGGLGGGAERECRWADGGGETGAGEWACVAALFELRAGGEKPEGGGDGERREEGGRYGAMWGRGQGRGDRVARG